MQAKSHDHGEARSKEQSKRDRSDDPASIEKSAVEARQGEIVLGGDARWIIAGCFVLFVLAVLILGPWW
jgi:hypothetical protein